MNKILISLIAATTILLISLCSCEKMSHNGKLDGMWQFLQISYNRNGAYDSTVNVQPQKAYFKIQLNMAEISWLGPTLIHDAKSSVIISRFQKQNNELKLYDFYYHYRTADSLFTDPDSLLLAPLGLHGLENHFKILRLTNKEMLLQSSFARISLKKF